MRLSDGDIAILYGTLVIGGTCFAAAVWWWGAWALFAFFFGF